MDQIHHLRLEVIRELLPVLDIAGTFVFALSGAMLGVQRRLDLFGVLVLAFVASSAGGILRDVLIGSTPPAAIADVRYVAVAAVAGLAIFVWYSPISRLRSKIQVLDAAGLALFAVAGTEKAIAFHLNPIMAALLGMLTGVGGGAARDILVARTPAILEGDLYAVAALAGAGVVALGHVFLWPIVPTALASAALCFAVRLAAIWRRWSLPVAQSSGGGEGSDPAAASSPRSET